MSVYWIVFGILIIANLFVSVALSRNDVLDRFQKVVQILIVWVIPFLGAIGLWIFHLSQGEDNSSSGGSFGGGHNDSIGVSSSD